MSVLFTVLALSDDFVIIIFFKYFTFLGCAYWFRKEFFL